MATLNQINMSLLNPNLPVGSIIDYAGNGLPTGYLECDGSEVLRSVYPELFEAIGTTWGAGDGSTTFNLPDLQDRSAIGRIVPKSGVNPNMAYTDFVSHCTTDYDAYSIYLAQNMSANTQYTLTLWDVDVYHSAKNSGTLNLMPYWGGGSYSLATYKPTSAELAHYPDGHGFHSDKIVLTFTAPNVTPSAYINLYNSVGYVAGTLRMHVGKWKLERGNQSTAWVERRWDHRGISNRSLSVGDFGGQSLVTPRVSQEPSHTHGMQSHTHSLNNHTHTTTIGSHSHPQVITADIGGSVAGRVTYVRDANNMTVIQQGYSASAVQTHSTDLGNKTSGGPSNNTSGGPSNNTTTAAGGGQPAPNMSPYAVVKKLILALPLGGGGGVF